MLLNDRLGVVAGEGWLAHQHLVQHARQGIHVTSRIHIAGRGLLGTHVRGCPDGHARSGQLVTARVPDEPGRDELAEQLTAAARASRAKAPASTSSTAAPATR